MKLLLSLMLLLSTQAFAGQQLLLDITTDIDSETSKIFIQTDKNEDVAALLHITFNGNSKVRRNRVSLEDAEKGAVLYKQKGRNIVTLTANNFSPANGGYVTLSFLRNGMTGSYGRLEIDLRRDGDKWGVYANKKKITALKFIGKRITLVGLVGIKYIRTY